MNRKNLLFAIAAVGALLGGLVAASAATGNLSLPTNASAQDGAGGCVDDDADDAAESADAETDDDNVEEQCGPDDDSDAEADDDAETDDDAEAARP